MIKFNNLSKEIPYLIFKEKYETSLSSNQKNIEAISISSYSLDKQEVNSRYVNLKFIQNKEFIFFSNYNSPKSQEFLSHQQISALIYWNSINMQIRIKANIFRTPQSYNNDYFKSRDTHKNALAISSNQSKPILSYENVLMNYKKSLNDDDLTSCPDYWGGFSFIPYYFEFWEGHDSRINKRNSYILDAGEWKHQILQP